MMTVAILGTGIPTPRSVIGDELSDARTEQRALEIRIERQQELVTRLRRSQATLRGRIGATTASLDATVSDLQAARRSISALRGDIRKVRADYARLVAEVDRLGDELRTTEAEDRAKRADLRERKVVLAERIRAAYDATRTSPFEAIISGNSFTQLLVDSSQQLERGRPGRAAGRADCE